MSITAADRIEELRTDLKAWEKQFTAQHNGRKAGRDDIKADALISKKYKEYNKLRSRAPDKATSQAHAISAARAQTPDDERPLNNTPNPPCSTPMKRKREGEPSTTTTHSAALLSPQGPSVIGPTPQRDGIVLGLFDMLPAETPSKKRSVLVDVAPNALRTPRKEAIEPADDTTLETRPRGEKTPLSTGKRFMLNQFATPKRRKLEEEGTPTSAFKGLATPAFLRRGNMLGAIDETDENTPRPAPWTRRSMGRSLTDMIADMRRQEDERLDEEADIMRELEMEEAGIVAPKKSRPPQVLVDNSQAQMPLGPDRGLESAEDESCDEGLGTEGKPKKVWKKKGLKRQTKQVKMRPNLAKPRPEPTFRPVDDEPEAEQSGIPGTQLADESSSPHDLSGSEDESDYASDDSHTAKKHRSLSKKVEEPSNAQGKEGFVKTAARKIKATAHANYRRLKIKTKGNSGGNKRFGRR